MRSANISKAKPYDLFETKSVLIDSHSISNIIREANLCTEDYNQFKERIEGPILAIVNKNKGSQSNSQRQTATNLRNDRLTVASIRNDENIKSTRNESNENE